MRYVVTLLEVFFSPLINEMNAGSSVQVLLTPLLLCHLFIIRFTYTS